MSHSKFRPVGQDRARPGQHRIRPAAQLVGQGQSLWSGEGLLPGWRDHAAPAVDGLLHRHKRPPQLHASGKWGQQPRRFDQQMRRVGMVQMRKRHHPQTRPGQSRRPARG